MQQLNGAGNAGVRSWERVGSRRPAHRDCIHLPYLFDGHKQAIVQRHGPSARITTVICIWTPAFLAPRVHPVINEAFELCGVNLRLWGEAQAVDQDSGAS